MADAIRGDGAPARSGSSVVQSSLSILLRAAEILLGGSPAPFTGRRSAPEPGRKDQKRPEGANVHENIVKGQARGNLEMPAGEEVTGRETPSTQGPRNGQRMNMQRAAEIGVEAPGIGRKVRGLPQEQPSEWGETGHECHTGGETRGIPANGQAKEQPEQRRAGWEAPGREGPRNGQEEPDERNTREVNPGVNRMQGGVNTAPPRQRADAGGLGVAREGITGSGCQGAHAHPRDEGMEEIVFGIGVGEETPGEERNREAGPGSEEPNALPRQPRNAAALGGAQRSGDKGKRPPGGDMRKTHPAETGGAATENPGWIGGGTLTEGVGVGSMPQTREPARAGTPRVNAEEEGVRDGTCIGSRPPPVQHKRTGPAVPQVAQTGLLPRIEGGQQLVLASRPRVDAEVREPTTPESLVSGGSSPSVDVSPYLSRERGHATPLGRAVSARRRLPFDFEEDPSPIYTSKFKVPRLAEGQRPSGGSVGSRQFAASHRREQSTPKELPRRGSHPDREEQEEGLEDLLGNTATLGLPQGSPRSAGHPGVLAPLAQGNAPIARSRGSRVETAEEAARTASRLTGRDLGEEPEREQEEARF